jgi:primosomal replication protein N
LDCNQTVICGKIIKLGVLRYTPAGVAVIDFTINHASRQIEAGITRQVLCEIFAVALGQMAITISDFKTDTMVKLTGFLNRKSRNNHQLVLHVNNIVQI